MFALLKRDPDVELNMIFTDRQKAIDAFQKEAESFDNPFEEDYLTLAEVEEGRDFGFGARGDFYGGEVILSLPEEI